MRAFLSKLVDRFQAKFPPNRLAFYLSPLFAAASGWVVSQAPTVLPGITVSPEVIAGLFAAGAVAGFTYVYRFVDGIQRDEAMQEIAARAQADRRAEVMAVLAREQPHLFTPEVINTLVE